MQWLSIFLIIIVALLALMQLGRAGQRGEKPAARDAAATPGEVPAPGDATIAGDLLRDEPLVAEFGRLSLKVTLAIDPARVADIDILRSRGAIDEGAFIDDCPVLRFEAIPPALLLQLFPQIAHAERFGVALQDEVAGPSLKHFYGTWPQIRAALRSFADTAGGFREVAQERGDLAGGSYFTENLFICIDRHRDWRLRITSIARDRLRAGIETQIAGMESRFASNQDAA